MGTCEPCILDNRLIGFQLVGDIRAAGILRSLLIQERDLRSLKGRLLDPSFGQGTIAWGSVMSLD